MRFNYTTAISYAAEYGETNKPKKRNHELEKN